MSEYKEYKWEDKMDGVISVQYSRHPFTDDMEFIKIWVIA